MANDREVIRQLRAMARDEAGRAFFGWLSEYRRNAESSTVELAEREATRWARDNIGGDILVDRSEVIALMRRLEDLQLGRFIVGRRGASSRFEFWSSRVQIGQAAMGQINRIDIEEEPVELERDDLLETHRMLIAAALELPITSVTIRIKE